MKCSNCSLLLLSLLLAGCTTTLPVGGQADSGANDQAFAPDAARPPVSGPRFGNAFMLTPPEATADLPAMPSLSCGVSGCLAAWHNGVAVRAARISPAGAVLDPTGIDLVVAATAAKESLPPIASSGLPPAGPFTVAERAGGFLVLWVAQEALVSVHVDSNGLASKPSRLFDYGHHEGFVSFGAAESAHNGAGPEQAVYLLTERHEPPQGLHLEKLWCGASGCHNAWKQWDLQTALIPGTSTLAVAQGHVVVSWVAGHRQDNAWQIERIEYRDLGDSSSFGGNRNTTRELSVPLQAGSIGAGVGLRSVKMVAAGDVVLHLWLQLIAAQKETQIFGHRLDFSSWTLLDAAPVLIGAGMRTEGLRPFVPEALALARESDFLVGIGAWLALPDGAVNPLGRLLARRGAWQSGDLTTSFPDGQQALLLAAAATANHNLIGLYWDNKPPVSVVQLPAGSSRWERHSASATLGGGLVSQAYPQLACNHARCFAAWRSGNEVRGARVSVASGKTLDQEPVPLAVGELTPQVLTDGSGFLLVGNRSTQRVHADGTLEAAHPLPESFRPQTGTYASGAYTLISVTDSKEPMVRALAVTPAGAPGAIVDIAPGGDVALTAMADGAVLLAYRSGGDYFIQRMEAAAPVGRSTKLPPMDPSAYALLSDRHSQWLLWIGTAAGRQTALYARPLGPEGQVIGQAAIWYWTDQRLTELRATSDEFGPAVLLGAEGYLDSSRATVLVRPALDANDVPLLARLPERPEAFSSCGAGTFFSVYGKRGYELGYPSQSTRQMGQFIVVPGHSRPR